MLIILLGISCRKVVSHIFQVTQFGKRERKGKFVAGVQNYMTKKILYTMKTSYDEGLITSRYHTTNSDRILHNVITGTPQIMN